MNESKQVKIPWSDLMQFGFGHMGLSSSQFWALSPRELMAAAGNFDANTAVGNVPDRTMLDQMMKANPDIKQGEHDETR